jgi:hypothetical protein
MTQPVTNIEVMQTPVAETGNTFVEPIPETTIAERHPQIEVDEGTPVISGVTNHTQSLRNQPLNDTLGQPSEAAVNVFAQMLNKKMGTNKPSVDIRAIQKN